MAATLDVVKKLEAFSENVTYDKLKAIVLRALRDNKEVLVTMQRDQLAAGLMSNEQQLSPKYISDPYFKTKKGAEAYDRFKKTRARKPTIQYAKASGYTNAIDGTPNLYISGKFYKGLQVRDISIKDGKALITIGNTDSITEAVRQKYGREVLGLTNRHIDIFYKYYIELDLFEYVKEYL